MCGHPGAIFLKKCLYPPTPHPTPPHPIENSCICPISWLQACGSHQKKQAWLTCNSDIWESIFIDVKYILDKEVLRLPLI